MCIYKYILVLMKRPDITCNIYLLYNKTYIYIVSMYIFRLSFYFPKCIYLIYLSLIIILSLFNTTIVLM